ncbi:hypothetical protein [Streptomyces sp. ME18-1-4]|uniref:hypothetical protein n=1 Tax=Streptomyces sp. ME18-1-4 TaxID=3028685 RepID=UPI0029A77CAD|nr:hypothetical protein [Streptomyces sp. ME18-1-4]MDX3247187.1 hypothetical protein [Streptomyces sp. ME18-1-4]
MSDDVYLKWDMQPVPGLRHPYVTTVPREMWDEFAGDARRKQMIHDLRITIIDYVQDVTGVRLDPEELTYTISAGAVHSGEESTR